MACRFNLNFGDLKCLSPTSLSCHARLLGPGGHPQIRGLIGAQVSLRLRQERIITNADLWDAIGALSVFSGRLSISSEYILPESQRIELLRSVHKDPFDTTPWKQSVTVRATSLFQAPELANVLTPDDKGKFTFNAEHWAGWMQQIGAEPMENNTPSPAPPGAQPHPVAGELHPWAFGSVLHLAISNFDGPFDGPIDPNVDPALLELLILVWVQQDAAKQARIRLTEMMALSITIITSKGSITVPQLRKVITATSRGMGAEGICLSLDAVVSGWNFLAKAWTGQQTGTDFKNLFQALGKVAAPFSPQFRLMCEETASKGLTGILTIKQTCTFNDFPWQELCELITQRTGQDELANATQFIEYLKGVSEGDNAAREETVEEKPAYLWAGWTFALGTQKQEKAFQNSAYPNLLYAAIQLRIRAGEESLRHYQFKDSMVISQKDVINNWITQYFEKCYYLTTQSSE